MGQIIRFPRARKRTKKKIDELLIERLPNIQDHIDIITVKFTCASCGNIGQFDIKGAIFKCINFYCGSCGVSYKLNNPLCSAKKQNKAT